MMLRRRWLILTILLVSIVTTFIVSLTMKPQYRANGEIELTIQSPHVTKFEDMNMLSTQIQTREFMQTNLNLLKSVTLADRVIDKLGLDHNPAFNPPPEQPGAISELISSAKAAVKDFFARLFPYTGTTVTGAGDPRLPELKLQKIIEDKFAKSLEVQLERDTTIFSLAFISIDPAVCRDVINTLIEEYISWQVDKKIDAAIAAKQRLAKQLRACQEQVSSSKKRKRRLNDFSRKAGIVSLESRP